MPTQLGSRVYWRTFLFCGITCSRGQVLHMYFTLLLTHLQPNFASIPSAIQNTVAAVTVQILLVIVTPLAFQLTIGAAFHKLLMLQFRGMFAVARLVVRCARAKRHLHSVPSTAVNDSKSQVELSSLHDQQSLRSLSESSGTSSSAASPSCGAHMPRLQSQSRSLGSSAHGPANLEVFGRV